MKSQSAAWLSTVARPNLLIGNPKAILTPDLPRRPNNALHVNEISPLEAASMTGAFIPVDGAYPQAFGRWVV